MRGAAVPRAERSGSHRIVDVEVGDLREAIAAIAGVATLARAASVGPRALGELLPGLRETCAALPTTVASALVSACDVLALSTGLEDDASSALLALVDEATRAGDDVRTALDAAHDKGLGARTRLALQASCERSATRLLRVRRSIELLQRASTSEPQAVALEDLLRALDGEQHDGTAIELTLLGDLDATVAVAPRVGAGLLLGALARAHALASGTSFAVTAAACAEHVEVTVQRHDTSQPSASQPGTSQPSASQPGTSQPRGSTLRLVLPEEAPGDERVLRLAAATLAAPVRVEGRTVRLDLLRA